MKEPILSREEVEALAHRICMKYEHSDYVDMRRYTFGLLTLEQFAAALESALLEKLCGEPVGFVEQFDLDQLATETAAAIFPKKETDADIPLYALKRSQS